MVTDIINHFYHDKSYLCPWIEEACSATTIKSNDQINEIEINLKMDLNILKDKQFPFTLIYCNIDIPFKIKYIDVNDDGFLVTKFKIEDNLIKIPTIYDNTEIHVSFHEKLNNNDFHYIILDEIKDCAFADFKDDIIVINHFNLTRNGINKTYTPRSTNISIKNLPDKSLDLRDKKKKIKIYQKDIDKYLFEVVINKNKRRS